MNTNIQEECALFVAHIICDSASVVAFVDWL